VTAGGEGYRTLRPKSDPSSACFNPHIYKASRFKPSRQSPWIESNHRVGEVDYLHPYGPQAIRAGEVSTRFENPVSFAKQAVLQSRGRYVVEHGK